MQDAVSQELLAEIHGLPRRLAWPLAFALRATGSARKASAHLREALEKNDADALRATPCGLRTYRVNIKVERLPELALAVSIEAEKELQYETYDHLAESIANCIREHVTQNKILRFCSAQTAFDLVSLGQVVVRRAEVGPFCTGVGARQGMQFVNRFEKLAAKTCADVMLYLKEKSVLCCSEVFVQTALCEYKKYVQGRCLGFGRVHGKPGKRAGRALLRDGTAKRARQSA